MVTARRLLAGCLKILTGLAARIAFAITGLALSCAAAVADDQTGGTCKTLDGVTVFSGPMSPWQGVPLRVVLVSERPLAGKLSLRGPDESEAAASSERRGGPPYFWTAEVAEPKAGNWQATFALETPDAGCTALASPITVKQKNPGGLRGTSKSVWPIRAAWNRDLENLYAAWIETLFDAPLDASPSWPVLHEVLRDPSRNLLHNYLGLREDDKKLVFKPDCADLPYFLRGYFAFKLGLPFGYGKCTRGGGGKPPRCFDWWNIESLEPPPKPPESSEKTGTAIPGLFDGLFGAPVKPPAPKPKPKFQSLPVAVADYLGETVANSVHSGSGRAPADSNNTDYYSVPLSADILRPGTIYIDPYGHILVIARRVAQTADSAGVILAVDGQPDGTIARKRFWRGNFLFADDPALGSPGFKRFRPVVRGKSGLRRLSNAEIAAHASYGDFSLEQTKMSVEDFYDRMDDVMSPDPLDPERAMLEAVAALDEQVKARVTSVENGRKYHERASGEVVMPDGPSIFETTGPWEDFATPSRDLRLLIAIDVVRGFPARVARRPERYAMPAGQSSDSVKAALDAKLETELAARSVSYTRTDGSSWTLSLKDVVGRMADLEMAYNLNDCVELRWGAPEGSAEAATCKRRAPGAQREKMSKYRPWFAERRRPPRG